MSVKAQAIIPTAGLGERFGANRPKSFMELNGKPIFIHTIERFENSSLVDSILLVVHEDYQDQYKESLKKYQIKKVKHVVLGGEFRHISVSNGLQMIDEDTEIVLVHDGVRPLISSALIDQSIQLCLKEDAVIVAVDMKPTIKRVDKESLTVSATLRRDALMEAQTPQVFKKEILRKAYAQEIDQVPTDDSFLVEQLGIKVKILKGDYKNIKITTKEDLEIAKTLLA